MADSLNIKPVTDSAGNPPKVYAVELQHDALPLMAGLGIKGRPLILFSDGLGLLNSRSEQDEEAAIKAVKSGRAADVTARDYPTSTIYPIDSSDYLTYLHKLGIISKLYWVPPYRGSVGGEPLDNFKEYLRAYGSTEDELKKLKQEKTFISGTVNGLPIVVSGLGELSPPISDAVMLIDLTFFNKLYKNEVTEPMLDLFASFVKMLSDVSPKVSHVIIVYSTAYGDLPMEKRFLGGYIKTYFTDPAALRDSPPDNWLIRANAMYDDTFFQTEQSLELYKKAAESAPDDPAAVYDLAQGYFAVKDLDNMAKNLDKAVELDNGYYPAYFKYAEYFTEKGIYGATQHFLDQAAIYAPDDPRIVIGFHMLHKATGEKNLAVADQKKLIDMGFNTPENVIQLAKDYGDAGSYKESIDAYKRAMKMLPVVGDDRMPSLLLGLAGSYEKAKMIGEADDTYKKALASTGNKDVQRMINSRYQKFLSDWKPFMEKNAN